MIYSGCTNHMIGEQSMSDSLTKSSGDHYITFAGNERGKILGTGNITLNSHFNLSKVLLVDTLGYNLLFISHSPKLPYIPYKETMVRHI